MLPGIFGIHLIWAVLFAFTLIMLFVGGLVTYLEPVLPQIFSDAFRSDAELFYRLQLNGPIEKRPNEKSTIDKSFNKESPIVGKPLNTSLHYA